MSRKIAIFKAGTALERVKNTHGDFEEFFIEGMDIPDSMSDVVDFTGEAKPALPERPAGIVITGSRRLVTEGSIVQDNVKAFVKAFCETGVPVLGVCFGHQILAELFGGHVGFLPGGKETGTVEVTLTERGGEDVLFSVLPPVFSVQTSHYETVSEIPESAACTVHGQRDRHHGLVFSSSAWGVQFHPEFTADIMRTYIMGQKESLERDGLDTDALIRGLRDDEAGKKLLQRFRDFALG